MRKWQPALSELARGKIVFLSIDWDDLVQSRTNSVDDTELFGWSVVGRESDTCSSSSPN